MNHPRREMLALFAGGDLRGFAKWRVRRHAAGCAECGVSVEKFREARTALATAADELPPGLDWEPLAREMRANIHVGLEASEAVAPVIARSPLGWRAGIAFASLAAVVVIGWVLSVPKLIPSPLASVSSGGSTIELSAAGVEWKQGLQGFALLHPRANRVAYSVDAGGAEARFVDVETNQVTITHVSLE